MERMPPSQFQPASPITLLGITLRAQAIRLYLERSLPDIPFPEHRCALESVREDLLTFILSALDPEPLKQAIRLCSGLMESPDGNSSDIALLLREMRTALLELSQVASAKREELAATGEIPWGISLPPKPR